MKNMIIDSGIQGLGYHCVTIVLEVMGQESGFRITIVLGVFKCQEYHCVGGI